MNHLISILLLLSSFKELRKVKSICDLISNILFQKGQLLNEINAINIDYSYEPEIMINSLVFFYIVNASEEFKLDNNNYTLKFLGAFKKHTCTDAPCNSFKMSTTWLTTVMSKCNNTVCETIGKNEEITGKNLNAEILKL